MRFTQKRICSGDEISIWVIESRDRKTSGDDITAGKRDEATGDDL